MEYTELGRTGMRVSVAGLGCGGRSRLGQRTGKSHDDSVRLVREAIDLGVNFIDTALNYGTEKIVGDAIGETSRADIVVSTKSEIRSADGLLSPADLTANLEQSLRNLQTDYVDIFHLHAVRDTDFRHAADHILPVLHREVERGRIRAIGITESGGGDKQHEMLTKAIDNGAFDVIMVAFHLMHQNASRTLLPRAETDRIGTLMMCVVRNFFSNPQSLARAVGELVDNGSLSDKLIDRERPLDFLVHATGANSPVDAAYRFVRHTPGVDVVLFGTGSPKHMADNITSILKPPLPSEDAQRIRDLFGNLIAVGL